MTDSNNDHKPAWERDGGDTRDPGDDPAADPATGPGLNPDAGVAYEDAAPERDPQTEALVAAAEDVRQAVPKPRPWRGPRSFLMLAAVLLAVTAMGAYALQFARRLERRAAETRMQTLDAQRQQYLEQREYFRAKGFRPAGEEAAPLTPAEFAELQALRSRFGLAPVPPEQAGTQPTTWPDTRPATRPADEPEV